MEKYKFITSNEVKRREVNRLFNKENKKIKIISGPDVREVLSDSDNVAIYKLLEIFKISQLNNIIIEDTFVEING
jgi:inosine/xanthosine triphosphate pyrophosphatase family protein